MSVSLRLSRGGSKKRPYYKVVVANSRAPRDGKYLEQVGTYNPLLAKDDANRVRLVEDRVRHRGTGRVLTPLTTSVANHPGNLPSRCGWRFPCFCTPVATRNVRSVQQMDLGSWISPIQGKLIPNPSARTESPLADGRFGDPG